MPDSLTLPPELTLARAAELKARLLEALAGGAPLALDGRGVTDVDAAGLQVLCAAGRSAAARGTSVSLTAGARSPALAEALALSGLGHEPTDHWLRAEVSRG